MPEADKAELKLDPTLNDLNRKVLTHRTDVASIVDKTHRPFILAVDNSYFVNHITRRNETVTHSFNNGLSKYPMHMWLEEVQSHLVIREREYLDNCRNWVAGGENLGYKGDRNYRQILPYIIARQLQENGDYLYFPYRRTKKVGESRLAGNGSVGYGGHVDLKDVVFDDKSIIDLTATLLKGAEREGNEEFVIFDAEGNKVPVIANMIQLTGQFIVDDTTEVNTLHVGVIVVVEIPQGYRVEAGEDELANWPAATAKQLLDDSTFNPESWTKIYLEYAELEAKFISEMRARVAANPNAAAADAEETLGGILSDLEEEVAALTADKAVLESGAVPALDGNDANDATFNETVTGDPTQTPTEEQVGEFIGDAQQDIDPPETTTASGLQYVDHTVGEGDEAKAGRNVTVHYTGWLRNEDGTKGPKFDSSKDRNDPFEFSLGSGMVIRGWDEGVQGIRVGGKRTLTIPSDLAYGTRGAGGIIPPNATLIFDVELLEVH